MRTTRPLNDSLKMHRERPEGADEQSFLSSMALLGDTIMWGQLAVSQALYKEVNGKSIKGEQAINARTMGERYNAVEKQAAGLANLFRVKKTKSGFSVSAPLAGEVLPEHRLANQTSLGRIGSSVSTGTVDHQRLALALSTKYDPEADKDGPVAEGLKKLQAFLAKRPELMDRSKSNVELRLPAAALYAAVDEDYVKAYTESLVEYEVSHKENCGDTMAGARLLYGAPQVIEGLTVYTGNVPKDVRELAGLGAYNVFRLDPRWLAKHGVADHPFVVELLHLLTALTRPCHSFLEFQVDAGTAEYLCQADFADVQPYHMAQWCQQLSSGLKSGNYSYETKSAQFVAQDVRAYDGPKVPRTNGEHLLTMKNGDIWFLPEADRIEEMAKDYSTYDGADGTDDFSFHTTLDVERETCEPEESTTTSPSRSWAVNKMRDWLQAAYYRKNMQVPSDFHTVENRAHDGWTQYFAFVRAWADATKDVAAEITIAPDETVSTCLLILRSLDHIDATKDLEQSLVVKLKGAALAYETQEPFTRPTQKPLENKVVFTDWLNNKLVYTNSGGVESTLDLSSAVPTTATHVKNKLDVQIGDDSSMDEKGRTFVHTLGIIAKVAILSGFKLDLNDPRYGLDVMSEIHYGDRNHGALALTDHVSSLEADAADSGGGSNLAHKLLMRIRSLRETLGREADRETLTPEGKKLVKQFPNMPSATGDVLTSSEILLGELPCYSMFSDMAKFLQTEMSSLDSVSIALDSVLSGPLSNRLTTIASTYVTMRALLPGEYASIIAEDRELRKAYINPVVKDHTKLPALAGASKSLVYVPHQARVRSMLTSNKPKYSYLDVDAGGGKTVLILSDVLDSLTSGLCTLPAVVCPAYLVKDYVKEANFVFEGRMNVIPINTDSVANYTFERLYQVITNSPPNTVLVISYDFIAGRISDEVYGRAPVTVYHNVEFLRQFLVDAAWFDEAHNLRKGSSQRTNAVRTFCADVPMLRLASGTSAVDQVTDIVSQFSLMDPTVFGDFDDFVAEYAEEVKGAKVVRWKPMAEQMVRRKMAENCMILTAKRREWASLLPERKENFYFVNLTKNQRSLYEAIVRETIEDIRENNPQLIKMMEEGDETNSAAIESILGPYLARLEQFMSAPGRDKAAKTLKDPADLTSPKAIKIASIVKDHIANKIPGKILIFTSYKASAEEIYKALPDSIRKQFIHYTADNKVACEKEFSNNPDKIGMIGVENSMNTGLNLQYVSRLIRVESVWSPGLMEQGESRVNRPNLKIKEFRTGLFFDWVLVDNSIDITKVGRLIAKQVSNARYENWDNPIYIGLETPPLVSMNLDSIIANNSFETELVEHFDALQGLIRCRKEDYEAFRNDPNAFKTAVPVKVGKPLEGSKMLLNPPYCPGMAIYGAADLDLEDLSTWRIANNDEDLIGRTIHCEFGDVEVVRLNKHTVQVRLPDGKRKGVQLEAAWVIGKERDDPRETRRILQEMVGMSDHVYIPNYYEETKQPIKLEAPKKPIEIDPKAKKSELDRTGLIPQDEGLPDGEVLLFATVINNRLALGVDTEDPDVSVKQLKDYGFTASGPSNYVWAEVKYARHLRAVLDGLTAKFTIKDSYLNVLEELYEAFNQGRSRLLNVDQAHAVEFRDFMRMRFRPCPIGELRPYPMLQDDSLYIVMEADKCPSALKVASKVKVPGVVWEREESPFALRWCDSKADLIATVKAMRKGGINVGNMEDLKADVKDLKLRMPKRRD